MRKAKLPNNTNGKKIMLNNNRKLRVFLCHASQDKTIVRELYQRLLAEGWIDPWLDEEKLLPGQDWDMEIEKAVESANVVLVCLSSTSVSKEGYIQRELRFALDIALEKPEGAIFIIPLRLDGCELPRRLRSWHYVDYYPVDQRKRVYQRLQQSLRIRYDSLNPQKETSENESFVEAKSFVSALKVESPIEMQNSDRLSISIPKTPTGILDLAGSAFTILFFLLAAFYSFGNTGDDIKLAMGGCAILTALFFVFKQQITVGRLVKFTTLFFVGYLSLLTSFEYSGLEISSQLSTLAGVLSLIVAGSLILNFQAPRRPAPYSSIFFAVFVFLSGLRWIFIAMNIYRSEITFLIVIIGIIAFIFWWLEL
jgi:hypothetical protein